MQEHQQHATGSVTPQVFEAASSWLSSNPAAANLPNDVKLELYGIYKFVTTPGPPDGSRPSIFYPTPRAKYDAWAAHSAKYVTHDDEGPQKARTRYVEIAEGLGWSSAEVTADEDEEIDLDEEDVAISQPSRNKGKEKDPGGLGPRVSVMAEPEEEVDDSSASPLHDAVIDNSLSAVQTILRSDRSALNTKDEFGNTPLHLATDRGHIEIAQALLHAGADRDAKDEDDQTPLQIAEALEREDLVDLLRSN